MSYGPEDQLQAQVVRFLRVAAPELLFFAVPNGGSRNLIEAKKLKATGVVAGVPDLTFVLPGGRIAFIELKAGKNGLQPSQKAFAEAAIANGAAWALCRSLEDVEAHLKVWGVPLKARAQ